MANIKIYIPTFVSDQNFNPARVNPRVFFYNGTLGCEPFLIESNDGGVISQTSIFAFPYFDHYGLEFQESKPTPGSDSLLFLNENAAYGTTPTESLYTKYWEKYVSLLYDPKTRLLDASAIIALGDYNDMELNDIVQFRGNYFHLRAINDYDVKTGTCNIQLLGPILDGSLTFEKIIDCTFDFTAETYTGTTTTSTTSTTTIAPTTTTTTSTTVAPTTTTTTSTTAGPTTTTTTSTTAGPTTTTTTSTTSGPTTTTTTSTTAALTKLFEVTVNNNTDITYSGGFGMFYQCDVQIFQAVEVGDVTGCNNTPLDSVPPGFSYNSVTGSFNCTDLTNVDIIGPNYAFQSGSTIPIHEYTSSLYVDNILVQTTEQLRGSFVSPSCIQDRLNMLLNSNTNLYTTYSVEFEIN